MLCKMAARLEGRGYPDALNMTPGRILFLSRIVEEEDRRSMKRSAIGARVAKYKKQDWNTFFKDDKGD